MIINGLQKLTLLDFPGKTACTVFFAGCDFRCPFCHNATLVRNEGYDIPEEEFFSFLETRKGRLDGVAITGGEPLMQADIGDFMKKIKDNGFLVKLDTNGSYPKRLKELVDKGLCDYVAMDVKASPEGYERAAGVKIPLEKISESIEFLMNCGIDYEFRTTVAKGAVLPEDFEGIGKWIAGAKRYYLQGFVDSGDILGEGAGAYSPNEMKEFLSVVKKYVPTAELRGVN